MGLQVLAHDRKGDGRALDLLLHSVAHSLRNPADRWNPSDRISSARSKSSRAPCEPCPYPQSDRDACAHLDGPVLRDAEVVRDVARGACHRDEDVVLPERQARTGPTLAAPAATGRTRRRSRSKFAASQRLGHVRALHEAEPHVTREKRSESFSTVTRPSSRRRGTSSVTTVRMTFWSCSTLLCFRLCSRAAGTSWALPGQEHGRARNPRRRAALGTCG